MSINSRLSNKEYENLSNDYEKNPPMLSGKPGFLTNIREEKLVTELLPPDYARIINMQAKAMLLSPSEVIQHAIKEQMVANI